MGLSADAGGVAIMCCAGWGVWVYGEDVMVKWEPSAGGIRGGEGMGAYAG